MINKDKIEPFVKLTYYQKPKAKVQPLCNVIVETGSDEEGESAGKATKRAGAKVKGAAKKAKK